MLCSTRVVSDESELVSVEQVFTGLGGKLPPLGQRVFPVLLEPVSVADVAFKIEVVVDGRMEGGKFSTGSRDRELEHNALTSPKK